MKAPTTVLLALLLALFLTACSDVKVLEHNTAVLTPAAQVETFHPMDGPYVLGVGDEMTISVWTNTDLQRKVKIDPSGAIDYPLVGQVKTFGLTVDQLRGQLEGRLAKYIVEPRVDISLTEFKSLNVFVLGEVRTPGAVSLQRYITPQEAIAAAGGYSESARNDFAVILRRDPQKDVLMGIAAPLGLRAKGQPAMVLHGGDIVYVPRSGIASVETFMQHITTLVNPLVNVARGLVMAPDVVNVLNGTAFQPVQTQVRSSTANSAQAIIPAQ
ncbi:polysaccharide export protein [Solidesulfovibrio carbinoliphilus subsp. oakridgensis]|uniref:Polysaccharide export protein n=1 Tax=Solidesulfovibrio carbinoliphilus subsp. oakridgensis TaxID=694327 RepID=G7Q6H3_9BACT|nr:polysaccharide biosynthesis/export family protein [Solidesulfovibrio carbinoliphilus]EHJ47586.1 polysaccharide export protein [Solidesulfovibrio carbinoliphilus subsp. oakridgensis]